MPLTDDDFEDAPQEIDLGVLNEVIGFRIRRIQNHLSRGFNDRLARKDIKPGVFSALALISANPGISQIGLSREVGFDKATVVQLVDRLEKMGWAERRRSTEDRRRHSLFVTPVGERSLEELKAVAQANEARIHEVLSTDEQAQLFALLDKMYSACFAEG